ncbi:T9SS type A sorting domain-containing protein [Candidatus Marinimicrobia bacterium]|nr:T9SS type A sorting domain-containing protein [Candidatus Neomarinimicrobiota bacterium]
MGANGFIGPMRPVLWADKDLDQGLNHLDFKLDADGEFIGAYQVSSYWDNDPRLLVLDSLTFAGQESDISYGRYPDGSNTWQYMMPSPGSFNSSAAEFSLLEPTDNTQITINENNVDTGAITFSWEDSWNFTDDEIVYHLQVFSAAIGDHDLDTTGTSALVSYEEIIELMEENNVTTAYIDWTVYALNGGSGALEASDFFVVIGGGLATLSSGTPTSISSSGNVYTLGLGLSGTPNGSEVVTVAPIGSAIYDVAGNVASTSQSNNSATMTDAFPPTFSSVALAADNSTIAVTTSEAVFSTSSGSGALAVADFVLSLSGGSATVNATPSSISASGNVYTLGLNLTGTPDGSEIVTVKPAATSIYDGNGNVASDNGRSTNAYSMSFDGANDYINVGNATALKIAGDVSVSAWVRIDDFDNTHATVFSMHDSFNGYSIRKESTENKLSFIVGDGTDRVRVTTGTLSTNTWYHIVGVNDGTDSKIYVNGALVNTAAQSNPAASSGEFLIGAHFSSLTGNNNRWWDGNIDEIAVWNDELTASEVSTIYNFGGGIDISVNSSSYASASNLQGYWNFNAGSGSSVADQSTNSNNGTVTSAAFSSDNNLSIFGFHNVTLNDQLAPTITSVSASTANGSYNAGDVIAVTVEFSENITVSGTPQLTLETGTTDGVASYNSGSGTSTLTFNYTVGNSENTDDLGYASTSALALNSGTIADAASNNATLTLPTPGASNSLKNNKALFVDNVAPTMLTVTEGANVSAVANDIDHQSNAASLVISWTASDTGSGISLYEYALGATSGGIETVSWTANGTSLSDTLTFSGQSLLTETTTYYLSVRATDAAGNVSTVSTGDGMYIDLTNPVAGTVIDGTTADISYTPSSSTLTFTWSDFSDGQSGIEYYNASIEDDDGNSVVAVTNVGTVTTWTVNNLSLVNAKTYEGIIQAVDYAGNVSTEVSSSVIVDTDGPVSGQVYDGGGNDIEWISSTTSAALYWTGFSDSLSGIDHFEYAIGTSLGGSQAASWTNALSRDSSASVTGMSLTHLTQYYSSVRAVDSVGNVSTAAISNGFTVDTDVPTVSYVREGETGELDIQNVDSLISARWLGADISTGSGVDFYEVALGTSVGDSSTVDWFMQDHPDTLEDIDDLDLSDATTYYVSVRVTDVAGNRSASASSDGILIDLSVPLLGSVNDGDSVDIAFTPSDSSITANWYGFTDSVSSIASYEVAIGDGTDEDNIAAWVNVDTNRTHTFTNVGLTNATEYYVHVRATDLAGNTSDDAMSNGVIVDTSPPVAGSVYDGLNLVDEYWTNTQEMLDLSWEDFADSLVGIASYEYAIGTASGDTNIVGWTNVGLDTSVSDTGLALLHGYTYYGSVRAIDVFGHISAAGISDGIRVDTYNPTVGVPKEGGMEDLDYQGPSDTLAIYWVGQDPFARELSHYEYGLGTSLGALDEINWTDNGAQSFVVIPNFDLQHEVTYYSSVRAYDMAGNMSNTVLGDGIMADLYPPTVGWVVDGLDEDESYTPSDSTIKANWDGFIDTSSNIHHYEYAVGTTAGEINVTDGWVSVDTNLFVIAELDLIEEQSYFVSVRALDSALNISAVVTTDGIITDFTAPLGNMVNDGQEADINRQNYADHYVANWDAFVETGSGLFTYEYALYNNDLNEYVTDWISTGETSVDIRGLELTENETYSLHVIGIDNVHNESEILMSNGCMVDLSAPAVPANYVGWFSQERIYLEWSPNQEIDVDYYSIYGGTEPNPTTLLLTTQDTTAEAFMTGFSDTTLYYLCMTATDIPGNESNHTEQITGIPQLAVVTRISPDPVNFYLADERELYVHMSQPLSDHGSVQASSLVFDEMYVTTTYSAEDTAIVISFNQEYASLDTIALTLFGIEDWSATSALDKNLQFTTYLLGDYDHNLVIDAADLGSFMMGWQNNDYQYELGPAVGDAPHLVPALDSIYDLEDVMAFVQMWYNRHQQSTLAMNIVDDQVGDILELYQEDRSLVMPLPEGAISGQVYIQYPPASKQLTTADDITSEQRIVLSSLDEVSGEILVEWADVSEHGMQVVSFDAQSLDRSDANVRVYYRIYGENQQVISSGSHQMKIKAIPDEYALHHNYPNPFNPTTTILYDVPQEGYVSLVIYDLMGREITKLMNGAMDAGYYSMQWNGKNSFGSTVSAGVYFYQIQINGFVQTKKMLLLK